MRLFTILTLLIFIFNLTVLFAQDVTLSIGKPEEVSMSPDILKAGLMEKSEQYPDAPNLQLEVAHFCEVGAEEIPGTTYSYSNPGFNTLGALIEIAFAWVDPKNQIIGLIFTQSPGGKNPRDKFMKLVRLAIIE